MASSKPKKGFSMSLGKPKALPSSSSATTKGGGDRVANGNSSGKQASAIGVAHDDDDDAAAGGGKRDYVTGIGGGKVVTKEVVVERGPRVITLASNPWAKSNSTTTATTAAVPPPAASTAARPADEPPAAEKSLDQLAAEAIAQESRRGDGRSDGGAANGYGLGLDSDRVIGMLGGKGAESPASAPPPPTTAGTNGGGGKKRTGLLEQNMIPGIMDVDGEDAKFKHDLGHRAEDLNARSKAYVDVPVAEFGAALLRGMGWKGPEGDGAGGDGAGAAGSALPTDIEPRHHRLGLGAQPKPPEEIKRPRKRKPGEKPRASDAQRLKIWEQKVQEEREREASRPAATAKLSVMDVVELSEGAGGEERRRPRAMVLKTQGVPGLNKISVRLEDTGEKVIVDKSSATRVSEDDLARRPFSEKKNCSSKKGGDSHAVEEESGSGSRHGSRKGSGKKRSRSRSRSRSMSSGSSDGGSVERDVYQGRALRDGGEKKSKTSSKKDKKKKHKKSSSSKREREPRRSSSSDERASSLSPGRHRDDRGNRETGRRRQADRGGDDRRAGKKGDERRGETSREDDVDRKHRRRDNAGGRNGGTSSSTNSSKSDNNNRQRSDSRDHQPAQERLAGSWLCANIRVRVVHKSYAGGRAYLGKGRVVDVPRVRQANVRMDLGDLVLEGVRERHLETVLPTRGGKVIVVRGEEKGATGKLLAKNKEKETALVQVYEDLRAITLSLDDVAEFTGMLDEDMDDVGY